MRLFEGSGQDDRINPKNKKGGCSKE